MGQAKKGDTVKVHYTGKLDDGTIFDSSKDRSPLQFRIGEGQVIPGLEQAVTGMNPGEEKNVNIPVDKAYGPHSKEKLVEVDRSMLPADMKPEVGQRLEGRQKSGQTVQVTVIAVSESKVTVDANHPLAGKDLIFDIKLEEII